MKEMDSGQAGQVDQDVQDVQDAQDVHNPLMGKIPPMPIHWLAPGKRERVETM